jgi:catechol 2,3-dioxygenase-like lactoylglutathione lyase family enzyme
MARGVIDWEALKSPEIVALKNAGPPQGLPFNITKIGHVVLVVSDLERSVEFYTQILGFRVSDVYPDTMMPGRMVFMRCNADHHGVALVGQGQGEQSHHIELHHMAFEVASIDEVFRAREHLKKHNVEIDFEGRRRAGVQVAVEFRDPDNHCLEIFWGLDQVGSGGHIRPPEEWREVFSLEDALDSAPPGQDVTLRDKSLRKK